MKRNGEKGGKGQEWAGEEKLRSCALITNVVGGPALGEVLTLREKAAARGPAAPLEGRRPGQRSSWPGNSRVRRA